MATSKVKAIATTQRKDRKMDDSGEGERIFRLQMSHYLNYYTESATGIEDQPNVNDFLNLLHSARTTRRRKKRSQKLLTHLHQIVVPTENEPLEHTLVNHYYRACFFWHFFWINGTENPNTLAQANSKAVSVMKPARYFFQQLVSTKMLRRQKRSTFDLARPFATTFSTTLQLIAEIIKSDKLLGETVWNYRSFMNAVAGCVSYTSPCRRATWVLRLRRLVAAGEAAIQKNATRRKRKGGIRNTRRRHREPTDPDTQSVQ